MIICMNYNDDGERHIARVEFILALQDNIQSIAQGYLDRYDEVYVVGFDNNCKELIDEVVLRGCRV